MFLNIPEIQATLRAENLDGWLLYDFHGSNPIATRLAGLSQHSKMTTRRWYYLIPATGKPHGLVHAIERHTLDELPGNKYTYAEQHELKSGLKKLLAGHRRISMEYSPNCAIPYISRVDAGTIDTIRQLGVEVVSSGDLIQRFEAVWDDRAFDLHQKASARLYRIKDRAFDAIAKQVESGITEFQIQKMMTAWFTDEGLITDSAPVVAAQENTGNPHYLPTAEQHRPIKKNELVLLDLWGKLDESGAVFADITWVGYTGKSVPIEYSQVFQVASQARDTAIAFVVKAAHEHHEVRGWQVDREAREVIESAGYGKNFIHRTGHSLGEQVHGNGTHMDDYETHDDRRLLPGSGFTIEPGIYFDAFGVRTEINMYFGQKDAKVTGPLQTEILVLG